MYSERLEKVLHQLEQEGLAQMIISDPVSIFYLTGRLIDPWERMYVLCLNTNGHHQFFINELYNVPEEVGAEKLYFSDTDDCVGLLAGRVDRTAAMGIDKDFPARFLLPLMERNPGVRYVNSSVCVDRVRACKDAREREAMRASSRINDACMAHLAQNLREGMTELEAAGVVTAFYQRAGADSASFEPLIGFGANAADGHHEPDGTRLKRGDCILADIGCVKDHYCSDMTRTFFFGEAPDRYRAVCELATRANEAAEAMIRPGVRFCDIDKTARDLITAGGYGPQFTHRLGHSIGISDHEYGDVSASNTDPVQPGMCFSVEPGIYLPGEMGVRVEDLVIVTETGCEILNHYTKTFTILG